MNKNFLSAHLILILCICISLGSCNLLNDTKEFHYGIPIKLVNKTDNEMFVTVYAIATSPESKSTAKVQPVFLRKKSFEPITYYLGSEVDFENLIICVISWEYDADLKSVILSKPPHMIRTFYNPEFEIGPEKYGIFAEFIIE